jgi:hypothetical protein
MGLVAHRLTPLHYELDGPGFKSRGGPVNQTFHPSGSINWYRPLLRVEVFSAAILLASLAYSLKVGLVRLTCKRSPLGIVYIPPSFLLVTCHSVKRCWSGGCVCKCRYTKPLPLTFFTIFKKNVLSFDSWQASISFKRIS